MKKILCYAFAVLSAALLPGSCAKQPREVIIDNEFVNKVMVNGGITVGDGFYSVALPDGRSLFLIGDSFTDEVDTNGIMHPTHMYRNSYIFYDPVTCKAESYVNSQGPLTSAAVPPGVTDEFKEWYWPQDGTVIGDKLYLFQTDLYQKSDGMWGFCSQWVDLITYQLPSMEILRQERVRKEYSDDLMFGAAVCKDDEYMYMYAPGVTNVGGKDLSQAFVARSREDDIYDDWEYLTKDGWSKDAAGMIPMEGTDSVDVSAQFNVFKLRDKYVLLSEQKSLFEGFIYTFVSDTPYGPWTNAKRIYDIPPFEREDLFAYNAMAHPEFEKDNMILVSYNVNSFNFNFGGFDVKDYRPVILWVPIEMILE